MAEPEKIVARFRDRKLVRGAVKDFRIDSDVVVIKGETPGQECGSKLLT